MKKQFNLESALNGEPFECEDGSQVLKWMYCEEQKDYPVTCCIKRLDTKVEVYTFTIDGFFRIIKNKTDLNLVMSPKKVTRWFNVYANKDYGFEIAGNYLTEQIAKDSRSMTERYIKTIPIEIELP